MEINKQCLISKIMMSKIKIFFIIFCGWCAFFLIDPISSFYILILDRYKKNIRLWISNPWPSIKGEKPLKVSPNFVIKQFRRLIWKIITSKIDVSDLWEITLYKYFRLSKFNCNLLNSMNFYIKLFPKECSTELFG